MLKKNRLFIHAFIATLFAFVAESIDIQKSNVDSTSDFTKISCVSEAEEDFHFYSYDFTRLFEDIATIGKVTFISVQKYPNFVIDFTGTQIYFINISVTGIRGPPNTFS